MLPIVSDRRMQQLIGFIHNNQLMKFYKSKEWFAVREQARKRDNYECQICKNNGLYKRVENVHHVKEVKTHPHLSLTLSNLQCLCLACHSVVHDRLGNQEKEGYTNIERW